jgi:F420-dependent oxidoreductase-like protein
MRLGLLLGHWGATPPDGVIERVQEAERSGYDSVWVAESWGNDAFTVATWLAAHTTTIKIGTGVVQLAARTPASTAMAAATLDHLSGGRLILGLGVSGPQVVEGWYGSPFDRPLTRTREYVEIIRRILPREGPLSYDGELYPLPFRGPGATGLGKPLKIMTHPLRANIPIFLAAEGPKNVAQTATIADGWLPLLYSPFRQEVFVGELARAPSGFEVAVAVMLNVIDDVWAGLRSVQAMLAFYIGGMGAAEGHNFHTNLMARMGCAEEAHLIQELFLAGRRDEAVTAVPLGFADEISLIGSPGRIKARLDVWATSPVTTLLVPAKTVEQVGQMANLVLKSELTDKVI